MTFDYKTIIKYKTLKKLKRFLILEFHFLNKFRNSFFNQVHIQKHNCFFLNL